MVVDDLPDVREVDAHPERGGRHHDTQAPFPEGRLHAVPLLVREPGVVRGRGKPAPADQLGQLDGRRAGAGVHQRPAVAWIEGLEQRLPLPLLSPAAACGELEVGSVEAGHHHDRVAHAQAGGDVVSHRGRGGGGEGRDRRAAAGLDGAVQETVVGSEVVAPAGDAVGLVDDQPADAEALQPGQEAWPREPLGCDVQQAQPSLLRLFELAHL